jgi:hypothetical protein
MGAPTQDLQQKVCHKYGWGYHYDKDSNGHWFVEVVVGMNIDNKYRFTSPHNSSNQATKGKVLTTKQKEQNVKVEKDIVSVNYQTFFQTLSKFMIQPVIMEPSGITFGTIHLKLSVSTLRAINLHRLFWFKYLLLPIPFWKLQRIKHYHQTYRD